MAPLEITPRLLPAVAPWWARLDLELLPDGRFYVLGKVTLSNGSLPMERRTHRFR